MTRSAELRSAAAGAGRRLGELALVMAVAVLVGFVVTRLMPGDAASVMLDGQAADPEFTQRLRKAAGIDEPLWRQFATYVTGLLRGDLGLSLRYGGTPVAALISEAAPTTLLLATAALLVATPAGLGAGLLSVRWRGKWPDGVVTAGSVVALSLSPVVLATWLMLAAVAVRGGGPSVEGVAWVFTLAAPVGALAIMPAGVIARITRAQLLEVLGQDYVRCARAKGLSETAILVRHALPNALAGVITVAGTAAGTILTSTAVVETVFNLPGLGRLAIFSVLARDYPLAGAVILVFALAQVVISFAVDLLIAVIDPRARGRMSGP